jgi:hypothetical protein
MIQHSTRTTLPLSQRSTLRTFMGFHGRTHDREAIEKWHAHEFQSWHPNKRFTAVGRASLVGNAYVPLEDGAQFMTTTVHLPRCDRFQSADAFGSYRSFPLCSSIESFIRFRSGKSFTALRRVLRRFRLLVRRLSLSRGSHGKARACEEISDGSRYDIGRLVLMGKTDKGGKRV